MDTEYENFRDLADNVRSGIDYEISLEIKNLEWAALAVHAGKIEPFTGRIARKFGKFGISNYVFKALRKPPEGKTFHITSTNFDEPYAEYLMNSISWALTIHGRKDRNEPKTVWVGGCYKDKRKKICKSLKNAGFNAKIELDTHGGINCRNICNRGRRGMGVQLEIPYSLRNKLGKNEHLLTDFVKACCCGD